VLPLVKSVLLDIGLTLGAYFQRSTRQIRLALDMVWKANDELRQFAQITSHDLKTPLATMANLCEEVLDEFGPQIPPAARELIAAARGRAFRMSATIDELLESSLAAGSGGRPREVASQRFIDEALERVRPLADRKHVRLVVRGPLPVVLGDPVRLREAFYNLLTNATQVVDEGRGWVEVSATSEPTQHVFCVCDNGPGIAPQDMPRLFAPFRHPRRHTAESHQPSPGGQRPLGHEPAAERDAGRTGERAAAQAEPNGDELDEPPPDARRHTLRRSAESSGASLAAGSGLGLYFTRMIVEQHGGRIWAESSPGHGARFFIALPRSAASPAPSGGSDGPTPARPSGTD
jgi:signal transduction histidine kinase